MMRLLGQVSIRVGRRSIRVNHYDSDHDRVTLINKKKAPDRRPRVLYEGQYPEDVSKYIQSLSFLPPVYGHLSHLPHIHLDTYLPTLPKYPPKVFINKSVHRLGMGCNWRGRKPHAGG